MTEMNAQSYSYNPPKWFRMLSPIIAFLGLYRFTNAFFLAKKSLPHTSPCESDSARNLLWDVLDFGLKDIEKLEELNILSRPMDQDRVTGPGGSTTTTSAGMINSQGCWMPRRVDAMAVIVVDALRFDFALEHLPKSMGSRIAAEREKESSVENSGTRGQSQLFKFVADPPTVTMQRLKGLTTGGLPTFADISGSFGGADVDEDSWVQQLHNVPLSKRGIFGTTNDENARHVQMAFVGDDTWIDLFPDQFDDSHPFPSFNTRDLDSVDDGCMLHLPRLLESFGSPKEANESNNETYIELLVTHFLGIDHVGHTYGPHNR